MHSNSCQAAVVNIVNPEPFVGERSLVKKDTTEPDYDCMFNPMLNDEYSNTENVASCGSGQLNLSKDREETVDELSPQQQRKKILLSKAHEFAERKKLDSSVLPFDLHVHLKSGEDTGINDQSREVTMPPVDQQMTELSVQKSGLDGVSKSVNHNTHVTSQSKFSSSGDNSGSGNICDIEGSKSGGNMEENSVTCDTKGANSVEDEDSAFDVYNIETALPDLDWKSLEEKLKLANEEARKIQEVSLKKKHL